jgi:hypothetical protein
MPQQSQLYIVASRHPRAGKTLLARLLIEFQRISGRPLVGYDLDPREPTFAGCFPNLVWPVDITDTRPDVAVRSHSGRSLAHDGDRSRLRTVRSILQSDGGDRLRRRSPAKVDPADCAVHHRLGADHRANLRRASPAFATDHFRARAQKPLRSWSSPRTFRRHRQNTR